MKLRLNKDIPPRAAVVVVALVLVASVVGSRESASPDAGALPSPAQALHAPAPGQNAMVELVELAADLDPGKLRRPAHEGAVKELFVTRSSSNPAQQQATAQTGGEPQRPPGPPALPFKYLGKIIDANHLLVFLSNGANLHTVSAGQTLENLYKVELVTEESVTFTYIPLGTRQTLVIPAPT